MSDLRALPRAEPRFLFEQSQKRSAGPLIVSLFVHSALIAIAVWIGMHPSVNSRAASLLKDTLNKDIVWLDVPGASGGGGGGGNQISEPPRIAQLKGEDKKTVPVQKPPQVEMPKDTPEENPIQNLVIPAETLAAANTVLRGAVEGIPSSDSLGPGRRGGAGNGFGTGDGPWTGPGLGQGNGGNQGGGPMRPGGDVQSPVPISQPKPQYTAEAMRAKIQGRILLECVVYPNGTVGEIRVLRSLDPTFGLDQEAIKAARAWLFKPGMRRGEPVVVLVTIEMAFTLR
jgi:protein TonB